MEQEILIQIYGIRTPEDALMTTGKGAHHIGVSYGRIMRTPGQVGFERAKAIFDVVPDSVVCVGLTVATDFEEIYEMVTTVRPDVLHLSGDIDGFSPDQIAKLVDQTEGLKIMQAIPVAGLEALDYVDAYQSVSDFFLLDTKAPEADDIGATGETHDWYLDKKIVEATDTPCIIAGGLDAKNVGDAIHVVRPWGVDSFSHTNLDNPPEEGGIKDPVKVGAFVKAVRKAS